MLEQAYRRRLEADLAKWQADGTITPAIGDAIRAALPPLRGSVNIAVVVGILGGLLIAAAFLAFVAANWSVIARPARFAILLAGIAAAYGLGAWFARTRHTVLADLAAAVGTIIFGAAIALTGQMYHLGEDFAGGMLLWALGALIAAALTGSRGALAVALTAGCIWAGMRASELYDGPYLPFLVLWLAAAALALAWRSSLASHLLGIAALGWWIAAARPSLEVIGAGAGLMLGGGLLLARSGRDPFAMLGRILSHYGAFALALAAGVRTAVGNDSELTHDLAAWVTGCAIAGVLAAIAAAAIARRPGPAFAGAAIACVLAIVNDLARPAGDAEPWLAYAIALAAMLCLVISGMLDEARPRVVAGWLGLASVIAAITWGVKGSLLRRSVFLAAAGAATVVIAVLLGRLMPKEARP